ncbi:hypothetical protein GCM10023321_50060 [Pseudonocardia eucalypti]|uniref:AMP-binding enzyme C-terminal domain-containing protein n=1 Tax=Pseudonocardia eucalypti TaxID=648755 RepID=A0ABP9QKI9_9PSEU
MAQGRPRTLKQAADPRFPLYPAYRQSHGRRRAACGTRRVLEAPGVKSWLPNAVEFIDEVPKTSVDEFSKKTLRDKFAGYKLPSS